MLLYWWKWNPYETSIFFRPSFFLPSFLPSFLPLPTWPPAMHIQHSKYCSLTYLLNTLCVTLCLPDSLHYTFHEPSVWPLAWPLMTPSTTPCMTPCMTPFMTPCMTPLHYPMHDLVPAWPRGAGGSSWPVGVSPAPALPPIWTRTINTSLIHSSVATPIC